MCPPKRVRARKELTIAKKQPQPDEPEIYEQTVDERGALRLDRPFTEDEAQAQDEANARQHAEERKRRFERRRPA